MEGSQTGRAVAGRIARRAVARQAAGGGHIVTWSTRTWLALMAQRMSVALHLAAAWEIAVELGLEGGEDEAAIFAGGAAATVV